MMLRWEYLRIWSYSGANFIKELHKKSLECSVNGAVSVFMSEIAPDEFKRIASKLIAPDF